MVLLPAVAWPGFRLGARWNRLGEAVKTRKKREKRGERMGEIWSKTRGQGGTIGIKCRIRILFPLVILLLAEYFLSCPSHLMTPAKDRPSEPIPHAGCIRAFSRPPPPPFWPAPLCAFAQSSAAAAPAPDADTTNAPLLNAGSFPLEGLRGVAEMRAEGLWKDAGKCC